MAVAEKLTNEERHAFTFWARGLKGFRECEGSDQIGPLRVHAGRCCTSVIMGTVTMRRRVHTLQELVDRWRSLGAPTARVAKNRYRRPSYWGRQGGRGAP